MKLSAILLQAVLLGVAQARDCTQVSVEGDATYCINGDICAGSGHEPDGYSCPVHGDVAVSGCNENLDSFDDKSGKCVAYTNASCDRVKTGAWGCVWGRHNHHNHHDHSDDDYEDTSFTPPSGCTQVSVEGDATYCVSGPVCSGSGDAPEGYHCPIAGDVAVQDCHGHLGTYDHASGQCVARVSATCQKIHTGAWGCVWNGGGDDGGDDDYEDTSYTPPSGCLEVSVQGDATYCINGPICLGSGDSPDGDRCPVAGDVAIKDCHDALDTYDEESGICVAPVSATCQKIETGAWGCVWSGGHHKNHRNRRHHGSGNSPWGTCGGVHYSGPTDCPSGYQCISHSEYYSQCKPNQLPVGELCGQDDGTNVWLHDSCANGATCTSISDTEFRCKSKHHKKHHHQ